MTPHSLATLLHPTDNPQQNDVVIAWSHTQQYRRHDFLRNVTALRCDIRTQSAQRWLLAHDDTYLFAVGLFALLAEKKHVVLPPNTQPGTLTALANYFDAVLHIPTSTITTVITIDTNNITLDLDALTVTLLTSGSTGEPKAIQKTLRCFDNEIHALEQQWGKQLHQANIFATVSHQHIYGLLFRLLWPLCTERAFASHTHQYPEQLVAELEQHRHTVLIASPAQLKRFSPALSLTSLQSSLCAVFSSGGALPAEAAMYWQQYWGHAPTEVLGSTETGGVAWRQQHHADSPWQLLPSVRVELDAHQQMMVHSPFTGSTEPLAMGDRAEWIGSNQLRLLGRADRLVKIEEKRLSLASVEQCLHTSPLIEEAHALVLTSTSGRYQLAVAASLKPAGQALLDRSGKLAVVDALRQHLLQHFERVLLPRKWRFIDRWPSNAQGKLSHQTLAALFQHKAQIEVIDTSVETRSLRITLPIDSVLFDGHFPTLPILPGVVQFDLAVRQCSNWYSLSRFRGIDKLKFQEPVIPGDIITLQLKNLGKGQVQFSYSLEDRSLSSGIIIFSG